VGDLLAMLLLLLVDDSRGSVERNILPGVERCVWSVVRLFEPEVAEADFLEAPWV